MDAAWGVVEHIPDEAHQGYGIFSGVAFRKQILNFWEDLQKPILDPVLLQKLHLGSCKAGGKSRRFLRFQTG